MGAVMIIYYKQVSEGFDDRKRFQLMQKVGMSRKEIRQTIQSQVVTVFFHAARGGRGAYNGSVSIDQAYHGNAEFPGQQSVSGCNSDYDCGVCRGLPDRLCADGAGVLQNCGIKRCTFLKHQRGFEKKLNKKNMRKRHPAQTENLWRMSFFAVLFINAVDGNFEKELLSVEFVFSIVFRESDGYIYVVARVMTDELFFKVIDVSVGADHKISAVSFVFPPWNSTPSMEPT